MFSTHAARVLVVAIAVAACSTLSAARSTASPTDGSAGVRPAPDDLQTLRNAVESAADDADIEARWGAALFKAGRREEALRALSFAVALSPRDVSFRLAMASALAESGDPSGALQVLRDVAHLSPSRTEAERAVSLARALTDPFRNLPADERSALATCFTSLEGDDPGKALDDAESAISRVPKSPAAHLLAALAADRVGDRERAIAELHQAAVLGASLPQPHRYLAELLSRDHPEEAAVEYGAAVERNPLDVEALSRLGSLQLERLNRPIDAADALERAADLRPQDVRLQALAVGAQLLAGFVGSGRDRLSRAIAALRGDAEALLRLAYALYEQRSRAPPSSRELLTQCIEQVLAGVTALDADNPAVERLRHVLDER